jgi:hypothetical protein
VSDEQVYIGSTSLGLPTQQRLVMHTIKLEAAYFHVVTHTLANPRKATVQKPKHVEEEEKKNEQHLPSNIDYSSCLLHE